MLKNDISKEEKFAHGCLKRPLFPFFALVDSSLSSRILHNAGSYDEPRKRYDGNGKCAKEEAECLAFH